MNVHILSFQFGPGFRTNHGVFSNFDQAVKASIPLMEKYGDFCWAIEEFTLNGEKLSESIWAPFENRWATI